MNYGSAVLLMSPEWVKPVFGGETNVNPRGGVFGPQGYGGGIFDGNSALSGLGGGALGALTESEAKSAQAEINTWLKAQGLCQIAVDGDVGPETCGAAIYYRDNSGYGGLSTVAGGVPSECDGIAPKFSPRDATQGCGPSGAGPATTAPAPKCPAGQALVNGKCVAVTPPVKKGMSSTAMFGIGAAVVLVAAGGAFLLAKGQKKGRRRR